MKRIKLNESKNPPDANGDCYVRMHVKKDNEILIPELKNYLGSIPSASVDEIGDKYCVSLFLPSDTILIANEDDNDDYYEVSYTKNKEFTLSFPLGFEFYVLKDFWEEITPVKCICLSSRKLVGPYVLYIDNTLPNSDLDYFIITVLKYNYPAADFLPNNGKRLLPKGEFSIELNMSWTNFQGEPFIAKKNINVHNLSENISLEVDFDKVMPMVSAINGNCTEEKRTELIHQFIDLVF